MTKEDVLQVLARLFRKINAVDPTLSNEEVGEAKLPEFAWFDQELALDPDFKKEVLFSMMVGALKKAHPNQVEPVIVPQDFTVFERQKTVSQLASQIAQDTPGRVL